MKNFYELKQYIRRFIESPNTEDDDDTNNINNAVDDFEYVFEDIKDIPPQFHATLGLLIILLSTKNIKPQVKEYLKKRLKEEIKYVKQFYAKH